MSGRTRKMLSPPDGPLLHALGRRRQREGGHGRSRRPSGPTGTKTLLEVIPSQTSGSSSPPGGMPASCDAALTAMAGIRSYVTSQPFFSRSATASFAPSSKFGIASRGFTGGLVHADHVERLVLLPTLGAGRTGDHGGRDQRGGSHAGDGDVPDSSQGSFPPVVTAGAPATSRVFLAEWTAERGSPAFCTCPRPAPDRTTPPARGSRNTLSRPPPRRGRRRPRAGPRTRSRRRRPRRGGPARAPRPGRTAP